MPTPRKSQPPSWPQFPGGTRMETPWLLLLLAFTVPPAQGDNSDFDLADALDDPGPDLSPDPAHHPVIPMVSQEVEATVATRTPKVSRRNFLSKSHCIRHPPTRPLLPAMTHIPPQVATPRLTTMVPRVSMRFRGNPMSGLAGVTLSGLPLTVDPTTPTGNTVARIVSPIVSVIVVALVGAGVSYFRSGQRRGCLRHTGSALGERREEEGKGVNQRTLGSAMELSLVTKGEEV
ncbi:hypothetical protein LEMLEM_LOCUS18103 [Lemmus lemmus]